MKTTTALRPFLRLVFCTPLVCVDEHNLATAKITTWLSLQAFLWPVLIDDWGQYGPEFFTVVHTICGSSVCNLLNVTLLVPIIQRWPLDLGGGGKDPCIRPLFVAHVIIAHFYFLFRSRNGEAGIMTMLGAGRFGFESRQRQEILPKTVQTCSWAQPACN